MVKLFVALHVYTKERWPKSSQIIRYGISGATGALVDFVVYVGLTRIFAFWREHFLSANIIAFIVASITTFLMHKYFSFEEKEGNATHQYLKFVVVSLIYIAIVQGLLYLGTVVLGMHDIVSKVIAMAIATVWNYFANRYWSFRVVPQ